MKIRFIGTGTLSSNNKNVSSYLIDDEVLFDIGNGTVREMQRLRIDMTKIKQIVVTHYHSDHLLDLPQYLVRRVIRKENEQELTIVAPANIEQTVGKLVDVVGSSLSRLYDFAATKVKFVGLSDREIYDVDDMKITAFAMKHAECSPNNGYIIQGGGYFRVFRGCVD